jgi:uncharacterized protein
MTLLDINILIYATDAGAPQQKVVDSWLRDLFLRPGKIGFPWPTVWGFVRVTTDSRLRARARTAESAFERIKDWLGQPEVLVVQPGPRHLEIFERLVVDCQASGPLVSDAVVAALAIEYGATLASTDRDFSRFPNLRWINPLNGQ